MKQVTARQFLFALDARNELAALGLIEGRGVFGAVRQGQAMGQRLQPRQSVDGEELWLSMLIDTMEQVSRPQSRPVTCDKSVLAQVSAQLARPASPYTDAVSHLACGTRSGKTVDRTHHAERFHRS